VRVTPPPNPSQGRTGALRTFHVWSVSCGLCDFGGEFETLDRKVRVQEDHFEWTGHDDWFELEFDRPYEIRQRFFPGQERGQR
jgi:hypothetical protein